MTTIKSLTTFRFTWSATQSTRVQQSSSNRIPNGPLGLLDTKQRPKGLWWSMQKVPSSQCSKSTVRNWATRRVREAFMDALRSKGLNKYGLLLEEPRGSGSDGHGMKALRKEYLKELHGSLVLRVDGSAVIASKEKLDLEARSLVDWLYGVGKPVGSAAAAQRRARQIGGYT